MRSLLPEICPRSNLCVIFRTLAASQSGCSLARMKLLLSGIAALLLASASSPIVAAEAAGTKVELEQLIKKIQTKAQGGKTAEADFADEIKEFDALLAKHQAEKTDETAEILLAEAGMYAQLFENPEKATELLQKLKTDYPETAAGKRADSLITMLAQQAEAGKVQRALRPGAPFPDFTETDLDGKPLSIAAYKGKVVLVDFWATWCGPCIAELPNVLKTFSKYHDKGLEIVGISLDSDKDKLTKFIADKKMTWPQYFDGQGWKNKLAAKYGVNSIPATYLLDKDGMIIAKGLRGEALEAAVAKALGAK